MIDLPIPQPMSDQEAPIPASAECGEPLVALSSLADKIRVYPYYYHQGYSSAMQDCYLRAGAAQLLQQAAERLPAGFSLVVLDGWRPYDLQTAIYEQFKQSLIAQGWSDDASLVAELTKYVALPSTDPEKPSPHITGGAVDLTIAGPDGWLEMGTDFDDFSPRAATRFYEMLPEQECGRREERIRSNRRWLYHLMTEVGFTNYPEEWWHYDYGNHHWAREKNAAPIYQSILSIDFSEKY
ncbi:M15 family metallopeptidase [Brevibacillus humidisoli]|uniref:M15 family metallopeptidase n=1 Tax=Brevibacillus humidisoli TaxID=2895522 RepID=UPI001E3F040B|nr:M15 family metallopeptidase [Brevibacillus humidisoli]UFJ41450.1 M15 family metallopeptidase [Brevibacillus humidisoli]